jgi:hypothetical protein
MTCREFLSVLSAEPQDPSGVTYRLPNCFLSDLRRKFGPASEVSYLENGQVLRLTFQLDDCKAIILSQSPSKQNPDLLQKPQMLIVPLGKTD